jgi:hypothetical protein
METLEKFDYEKQGTDFLKQTRTTLTVTYLRTGKHFDGDKEDRDIYKCVLQRGTRKYEFEFGQSIFHSGRFVVGYKDRFRFYTMPTWAQMPSGYRHEEVKKNPNFQIPTAYSVLCCLQKYDVGTLDDFISEFGYTFETSSQYKAMEKTYHAVVKEFNAVQALFNDAELEQLQEIQ